MHQIHRHEDAVKYLDDLSKTEILQKSLYQNEQNQFSGMALAGRWSDTLM